MTETLAAGLAGAVAAKDWEGLQELLHPEVDFRGMTPGRVWEADGPDGVVATFASWFDDDDVVEGIEALQTDAFADRERVGYRVRVRNKDGLHLAEQQAYLTEREGRIGWLRVLCAGYRPVNDDLTPDPARQARVRAPVTTASEPV